jgi:acylphosphatase
MIVRRLLIQGRVQGVGFRESMVAVARVAGVDGWVRNRRDDSVEALVQGAPEAVARVIAWAQRGPGAARVDGVDAGDVPLDASLVEFVRRPTR